MTSLSTIPEDLQSLWSNGVSPSPEDLKVFCDNVGDAVTSSFQDAVSQEPRTILRMSSIGKPARQLWYESKYVDNPEELDYSLRIKFLYGHLLEELLVLLLKMSGHSVEDQQLEHDIDGIKGHQDARVDGILVDFKSPLYGDDRSCRKNKKFKESS